MELFTDIPTPAVLIDQPTVRRNIAKLAAYAREHRMGIRPHTKTHKSLNMARMQLEAGAIGLTVAKAGEAQVMADASDDILVAYPAFDPYRRAVLCELARSKTIRIAVDSQYAVEMLAEAARGVGVTLGILIDMDVGLHRTGVGSPRECLRLAQLVERSGGVRLDGIMCYPGQIKQPPEQQAEPVAGVQVILQEAIELWKQAGLKAVIVSGGSTPSAYQSHFVPALTEIRPGTYIYNDVSTLACKCCALEDCAAAVLCTVISTAVSGKFILDAGSKTLTQDRCAVDPETAGHGLILEYPDARVMKLTEEHAEVDASRCPRRPKLGERVRVIPNHICPCINLHDSVYLRHEDCAMELMPIDARGRTV